VHGAGGAAGATGSAGGSGGGGFAQASHATHAIAMTIRPLIRAETIRSLEIIRKGGRFLRPPRSEAQPSEVHSLACAAMRFTALLLASCLVALRAAAQPVAPDPRLTALPAVVGEPSSDIVEDKEDTVLDIAYRHRLGFDRVERMNPQIKNLWIPEIGTVVRLPTEHILPEPPWRGLVINVPEMQLYDFTAKNAQGEPEVFAIAIGDEVDPSLMGEFKIGRKRAQPAWHVPKSIQAERPGLPTVGPPGPDNPLGPYGMTIGSTSYGIHGSNNEWSIGREATHGCIRLYNDQIEKLFLRTKEKTPIRLLYQTVKVGQRGSTIYLESHPDLYNKDPLREQVIVEKLRALDLLQYVDAIRLHRAIEEQRGTPVPIATLPPLEAAPEGLPPTPITQAP
jgi:L,D-transpeptidase ErfK/SrfK